jgi:hypothetical protein
MIEEKIKLNSKLIVVDAFKSGQKQNETPVYEENFEIQILNFILARVNNAFASKL